MNQNAIKKLVSAAMFFALGLVLPFVTGHIPEIGNMLLPMHLPVLLCGFVCGWKYGLAIGALLPIIRSLIFGMPPFFPNGVTMAFELATYGFLTGFLYMIFRKKNLTSIYISLTTAMIAGRIVKGIANAICYGIADKGYTFMMFISGSFIEAVPGIIIQLILIPALLLATKKAKPK